MHSNTNTERRINLCLGDNKSERRISLGDNDKKKSYWKTTLGLGLGLGGLSWFGIRWFEFDMCLRAVGASALCAFNLLAPFLGSRLAPFDTRLVLVRVWFIYICVVIQSEMVMEMGLKKLNGEKEKCEQCQWR